jgi:hypothetical protein
MAKQGFGPPSDTPEKGRGYHGFSRYATLSPNVAAQGVKSVNINLTFEEALKLSLALDSCLHSINRYHRGTKKGRSTGICLSVKTGTSSIAVIEAVLRSAETSD